MKIDLNKLLNIIFNLMHGNKQKKHKNNYFKLLNNNLEKTHKNGVIKLII
jgi:hypothetical protein